MSRMELADAIHDAEEQYRRENPIIQEFKLVGLSAPMSFTCANFGKEDIFWAKNGLTDDRHRALRNWAKEDDDFWKQGWVVVVQHEGLYGDGTPKNPVGIEVKIAEPRII